MRQGHYGKAQFAEALASLGLRKGDTVFSHSNIGFFGIPSGEGDSKTLATSSILEAFMDVIGSEGTLVVPTFTYSFPKGQPFDPDNTPSQNCGIFSEFIRTRKDALRSSHPCVSAAAIGSKAMALTQDISDNAYDEGSLFARLFKAQAKICNLNFDAGSTLIHYVERILKVPYRFDKTFKGTLIRDGVPSDASATICVRMLSDDRLEAAFEPFTRLAIEKGLFKTAKVGRGSIGVISTADTFALIKDTLPKRPFLLTKADGADPSSVRLIPE